MVRVEGGCLGGRLERDEDAGWVGLAQVGLVEHVAEAEDDSPPPPTAPPTAPLCA